MEKVYYDGKNYYTKLFVETKNSDLVIIFPGGGYTHTSNREAEVIGEKINAIGKSAIVFHYREDLKTYPDVFLNIASALKAFDYTNFNKVYGLGFSAGGHLALEIGLHYNYYGLNKWNGLILGYPVVSSSLECIHEGSFKNLLGSHDNEELRRRFSMENEVTKDSPKLFLFATSTDESVPVLNSLKLMNAYAKNKVNFASFIYPLGHHGLGLATKETARDDRDIIPYVSTWFSLLVEWFKNEDND